MNRVVNMRLLPDGSGRVRIHYFVWDDKGPVEMPRSVVMTGRGPVKLGGSADGAYHMGRIACEPARDSALPQEQNGVIHPCCHSDDPRAVTCPECMASEDYKKSTAILSEMVNTAQ